MTVDVNVRQIHLTANLPFSSKLWKLLTWTRKFVVGSKEMAQKYKGNILFITFFGLLTRKLQITVYGYFSILFICFQYTYIGQKQHENWFFTIFI